MNLENIKQGGYRIALETELGVQSQSMIALTNKFKFGDAVICAKNCVQLLEELVKITAEPKWVKVDQTK